MRIFLPMSLGFLVLAALLPTTAQGEGGSSSWYASVEALWLKPHMNDSIAFNISGPTEDVITPFDGDYELTPRVTLGYKNWNAVGYRLRYWEYDHLVDSVAADRAVNENSRVRVREGLGTFGDDITRTMWGSVGTVEAAYALEMQVWDLEATQDLCWRGTNVNLFGGVRYVYMRQDYVGVNTSAGSDNSVAHAHNFRGFGLTIGLEVKRPVGIGGLNVYLGWRESVVFGESDRVIIASPTTFITSRNADELMVISELQLGVEANRQLTYATAVFLRAGLEGQVWHGAGGPNDIESDLAMWGFTLSGGIIR